MAIRGGALMAMELVTDKITVASIKDALYLVHKCCLDKAAESITAELDLEAANYIEDARTILRLIKTLRSA